MDFKQCSALLYKGMHSEEMKKKWIQNIWIQNHTMIANIMVIYPKTPWRTMAIREPRDAGRLTHFNWRAR